MAVAIRQTVTPAFLLTQWRGQGWSTVRSSIVRPVPGDAARQPTVHLQLDAFEWFDVTLFGVGNVDDGIARMRAAIQQRGSDLYAYGLFTRTDVDLLGFKVIRYRLVLLHSQVQLVEFAVAILAITFAALVFFQYVTTGQSPLLKDLQNMWGSGVTSLGAAVGQVGAAISNTYITAALALGGIAVAFGVISKSVGVKAPRTPQAPSGSIGVRAGPVSARASS